MRAEATKATYRQALESLRVRKAKITVAAVCREAGLTRNPLYANHHDVLADILAEMRKQRENPRAKTKPTPRNSRQKRRQAAASRVVELSRRLVAAESANLTLLHRLAIAEDRLQTLRREERQRKIVRLSPPP